MKFQNLVCPKRGDGGRPVTPNKSIRKNQHFKKSASSKSDQYYRGETFCSPHIFSNVVNFHRICGCSAMESSEDEHVLFAIKDNAIGGVVT
jgi:hypothetical protein